MTRKALPSNIFDEEWVFVAPYLTQMDEDALQRECPLREAYNGPQHLPIGGRAWFRLDGTLPCRLESEKRRPVCRRHAGCVTPVASRRLSSKRRFSQIERSLQ